MARSRYCSPIFPRPAASPRRCASPRWPRPTSCRSIRTRSMTGINMAATHPFPRRDRQRRLFRGRRVEEQSFPRRADHHALQGRQGRLRTAAGEARHRRRGRTKTSSRSTRRSKGRATFEFGVTAKSKRTNDNARCFWKAAAALATRRSPAPTFPTRRSASSCRTRPAASTTRSARIVAQKCSDDWGQPAIVENRPGRRHADRHRRASRRRRADGYTLLVVASRSR